MFEDMRSKSGRLETPDGGAIMVILAVAIAAIMAVSFLLKGCS